MNEPPYHYGFIVLVQFYCVFMLMVLQFEMKSIVYLSCCVAQFTLRAKHNSSFLKAFQVS